MYYENFEMLCKRDGIKPSVVSKATGISTATLTSWKQGKYTPKQDKLQLISDYFNVSVDFLMTGKEPDNKERAKIDAALARQNNRIKEYMLKFANLSEEKRNQIMSLIDMLEEK